MSRRDRLEARLERRREWADRASERSEQRLATASTMAQAIPFGQPILVGHHSEKRDRAYRGRIDNNYRKGFELQKLAEHHEQKADGLEAQLAGSIFSDDDNAIEAIEARIREREAEREQMRLVNKLYRKADVEGLAALGINYENLKAKLAAAGPYFGKAPHMPYELSNLGARILSDKKRIEHIRHMNAMKAKAEDAPGGVNVIRHSNGYCTVTFAEKPDRAVLNSLKANGFRWGSGSWFGPTDKLPNNIEPEVMPCTTN